MEAIYIHETLRPSRYAFLLKQGDWNTALLAVSLNTILWGGVYNPLVPLDDLEIRDSLLRAFDPDCLVNLTTDAVPAELAKRYAHRVVERDNLLKTDPRNSLHVLAFGFNIVPIVKHISKEARAFATATRVALLKPSPPASWQKFVAFSYGSFQWLPKMHTYFERLYQDSLGAKVLDLPNGTPPSNYGNFISPIDLTRYGLRLYGGHASLSSHIIYIGDHRSLEDLIEFWNIRATGRTVVFIPVAFYRSFEPLIRLVAREGRYPINEQVENHADLQKGSSIADEVFDGICAWIKTLNLGPLSKRTWSPRFMTDTENYVGDIHIANIQASEAEEISILDEEGRMTPVKAVSPPYVDEWRMRKGDFTWSIEIRMNGGYFEQEWMFSLPNEPAVENVARRTVIAPPGRLRLGRRGLVLQQDWSTSTIQVMPIRTEEVFRAIFEQAGYYAEASEPGQYATRIIKSMGTLHGGCRIFKIQGVREVLKQLADGSTLTKYNIYNIVMSQSPGQHGKNWRPELYNDLILHRGQKGPLNFTTIFDVLLEKHIIRPGFEFECRFCSKRDWYHVSEFGEEFTCRYCFARQRVNFASVRDWQYKADGLFQIPDLVQGSIAVIVSLWRLGDLSHWHGRYVTSQNLIEKSTGRHLEIDYAFLVMGTFDTSYDLILGEVKQFNNFTDREFQKMTELSDRFSRHLSRKPYLAFSTLKEHFSTVEKEGLQDLVSRGYKVIALTREELDPYFLRFRGLAHSYAVTLEDLSRNSIKLNVE